MPALRSAALLALPALVAVAAPPAGPRVQEEPPAQDPGPLLRFRAQRLKEALGLTQEQSQKIARRWARFDLERFQRQRELTNLRMRFNDVLMGPGSEDQKSAQIKPLLEQFLSLRRQQNDLKQQFEDDIRADLTPAQQARLVLLVDEMTKRLTEALKERRQERRGF